MTRLFKKNLAARPQILFLNQERKLGLGLICAFLFSACTTSKPTSPKAPESEIISQKIAEHKTPFYRLWRGNKRIKWFNDAQKEFSYQDFLARLNEWMIPATTSCCSEKSLLAYLPALLKQEKRPSSLFDELALVVYKSRETYADLRANDAEGKAYGPLHALVFEMGTKGSPSSSRSIVPVPFDAKAEFILKDAETGLPEQAFDVKMSSIEDTNWQAGFTVVRVLTRKASVTEPVYLKNIHAYLSDAQSKAVGLKSFVTLVTSDSMIEYQNWLSREQFLAFKKSGSLKFQKAALNLFQETYVQSKKALSTDPLRYEDLRSGEAASIEFTPGKKAGQVRGLPSL